MQDSHDHNLKKIIQDDPSLVWYTDSTLNLNDKSIFEHVLNYGTWGQVQEVLKTIGLREAYNLYKSMVDKPRSNIKPRVKHYFDLYFSHASRNSN